MDDMTRGRNPTETPEDVIRAAKKIDGPVFFASELSQHLEIGDMRIRQRLRELEDRGIIQHKTATQTKAWWFVSS
jgi:predicted ArsR family transcriptional regulator